MPSDPFGAPGPTAAPLNAPDARADLLDAVAYGRDEIALLRGVVGRIPDALHGERPRPDRLSLRETYAVLAARDRARTAALAAGPDAPPGPDAADAPPDGAADRPTDALLDEATAARQAWHDALAALPGTAWAAPDAPVGARVRAALLADAALLRALAESLFDVRTRPGG